MTWKDLSFADVKRGYFDALRRWRGTGAYDALLEMRELGWILARKRTVRREYIKSSP